MEPGGQTDIVVVGAGIAGLSLASELAQFARVLVVEAEDAPARHSTSRSAAVLVEALEDALVGALTRRTRQWLDSPPAGFGEVPLSRPMGSITIAQAGEEEALAAFLDQWQGVGLDMTAMAPAHAVARVPILRASEIAGAVWDPGMLALDVDALVTGHQRLLRARGGSVRTDFRVTGVQRDGAGWLLDNGEQQIRAAMVVNAAGAWAAELGGLFGSRVQGPVPHRRTAVLVDPPHDPTGWPMVHGVGGAWYFREDAGRLLLSPADETPSPPCDAAPDELDVATAVARVQAVADLPVTRVAHRWAGLRTFCRDRLPVVGHDPEVPGLFWLAGQGGFGVQTSAGMAALAAALLQGRSPDDDLLQAFEAFGADPADVDPKRLMADKEPA